MRRLALLTILTLLACRRTHPVPTVEPDAPPSPPPAPVAAAPAAPPEPEPAPWWAQAADAGRSNPPSPAEIRAQLDPLFPELKTCVKAAGPIAAGARLSLRVRIEPSGDAADAAILGAPSARSCITELFMRKLHLPAWRGSPTYFEIVLSSTGDPLMPVGDAG